MLRTFFPQELVHRCSHLGRPCQPLLPQFVCCYATPPKDFRGKRSALLALDVNKALVPGHQGNLFLFGLISTCLVVQGVLEAFVHLLPTKAKDLTHAGTAFPLLESRPATILVPLLCVVDIGFASGIFLDCLLGCLVATASLLLLLGGNFGWC